MRLDAIPHNPETELALLGGLLGAPEMAPEVLAVARPEDFWVPRHRRIADAISHLLGRGVSPDLQAVCEEMDRRGHKGPDGTAEMLWDLHERRFHSANLAYHAQVVRDYSLRRRLIDAAQAMLDGARDGDRPFTEIIGESERLVMEVAGDETTDDVVPAVEAVDRAIERLVARKRGVVPGTATGFKALDDMTGGMGKGQLIVLAARPGQGKTAAGLQIGLNVAIELSEPALFFSIEMGEDEIADRILVQRATLDGSSFRRGHVTDDDEILIAGVRDAVSQGHLYLCDRSVTSARIAALSRRQRMRTGLSIVLVDYAQLISSEARRGESRQEEVSRIARDLKALSRELKIPVLALSQLNRKVESREDHRPMMSDLRESGELENAAHHIWLLHRPEYYDPTDRPGYAELIVAKNRNGPVGSIGLEFVKEQMRFRPWVGPAPDGTDNGRPVEGAADDQEDPF